MEEFLIKEIRAVISFACEPVSVLIVHALSTPRRV